MAWKLYSFAGTWYLESERDYDDAGLAAAYADARLELMSDPDWMGRPANRIYSNHPCTRDVMQRMVEGHGFRRPVPGASA